MNDELKNKEHMPLGFQTVNGIRLYNAGTEIISSATVDNIGIFPNMSSPYRFVYDKNMSAHDACIHFLKCMNITPPSTPVICVAGVLGIMRQLIRDANVPLPSTLYIVAPSQFKKTTTTIFLSCLYNRDCIMNNRHLVCLRINSSNVKIEEYAEKLKDSVFVLDDLYKEPDRSVRKENERHLRNLIRNQADDTPRTTALTEYRTNCQTIITAEYLLESKTDIGRVLVVNLESPIDSHRLSECQEEPLALSTFYLFFIRWLIDGYDSIVNRLRNEFNDYRSDQNQKHSYYERLNEQHFLYNFAFDLLIKYISTVLHNINLLQYKRQFDFYLSNYIRKQDYIMNSLSAREIVLDNFSYELMKLIEEGRICIGDKKDECFEKGKYLYLSSQSFSLALLQKYGQKISTKKISSYFREHAISESYNDNRNKKYNNHRYLVLDKKALSIDAQMFDTCFSSLFYKH